MARKERNDIDYFPHSVTHGKKMFYLRSKYGNDGYAVWFMLLENLGKASYHYLDLSDEIELMYLSSELKVSDIVLKEIIESLVKLSEFDKELWEENSILFNEKFIDNISDAYKKRNNKCIDRNSLLILLEAKGILKPLKSIPKPLKSTIKGVDNPQRIVKDSIEEETIINTDIDFLISLYPDICEGRKCSTRKGGDSIKAKLKKILSKKSKEDIEASIKSYVSDCSNSKTYLMNFSKFLDELPQPSKKLNLLDDICKDLKTTSSEIERKSGKTKGEIERYVSFLMDNRYKGTPRTYESVFTEMIKYYHDK